MAGNKAFLDHKNFETKPRRNSYDLSKSVNLTGKLGCEIPVGLWEVNAGDSIKIDSSFALNFFPTVFPLQTPLTARIYFFYGKNRAMWDEFKDFAYNNKQPVHPYIMQPNGMFWKTGSLADYLGVPTTYSKLATLDFYGVWPAYPTNLHLLRDYVYTSRYVESIDFSDPTKNMTQTLDDYSLVTSGIPILPINRLFTISDIARSSFSFKISNYVSTTHLYVRLYLNLTGNGSGDNLFYFVGSFRATSDTFTNSDIFTIAITLPPLPGQRDPYVYNGNMSLLQFVTLLHDRNFSNATIRFVYACDSNSLLFETPTSVAPGPYVEDNNYNYNGVVFSATQADLKELYDVNNPFAADPEPVIPINALPFRLYEAIHNSYFRDEKNDPFMINGEPEPNKWNTTIASGADNTPYKLYFRNWEADFLTTASQTPQQGLAPLVGINYRGDMEFLNDDGTIAKIRPTIDEDGETITGISGVVDNGSPESMRSALDLISSGISINDFREVNSLQRWLEDNIRRGLRYRDQVLASTGVKIKYDEMDLPIFLGGYSRPVQMTPVTQSTPSTADDNALGDRAGQLGVFGGSNHSITHYCDEAGFVMAILCVTPTPVYSQLLPKYFLKEDALSYYHPQFGHIGMQPIDYREVCPVQAFNEGKNVYDTFGYQRAWYDLVGSVDEVHGQMRTTMRDYVMNRTFAGVPELGADFLHIDPQQLNQVFAFTDAEEDVFQGQIYHKVYIKRAIPRFGIPRLE